MKVPVSFCDSDMMWMLVVLVPLAALAALLCWLRMRKLRCPRCSCTARMDGKVVIVTGADSGIGKETARGLADRGARVIMAGIDQQMAIAAREEIIASTGNRDVVVKYLDLLSLRSVREFVKEVQQTEERLDVLVNNAGALTMGNELSEDGLAKGMQVNFFGPFLLTCLLTDLLRKSTPSRIIYVASSAHGYRSFDIDKINDREKDSFQQYCDSKLCTVVVAQHLAEKLRGTGITVNSLHPGLVGNTLIAREHVDKSCILSFVMNILTTMMTYLYVKTPWEGAQTSIHLAVSEEGGRVSGKYFVDLKQRRVGGAARQEGLGEQVWRRSEEYVKLQDHERPFAS